MIYIYIMEVIDYTKRFNIPINNCGTHAYIFQKTFFLCYSRGYRFREDRSNGEFVTPKRNTKLR